MFQKLWHSDTCNQVKSCTKDERPNQSQWELTVAFNKEHSLAVKMKYHPIQQCFQRLWTFYIVLYYDLTSLIAQ